MLDTVAVGREIALPFVTSACRRYALPYDPESGEAMIWWAGYDCGSVRAVMGWGDAAPLLLVLGPFGDGSLLEDMWINEMLLGLEGMKGAIIIAPASPSLCIRVQSEQLERYGECHYARTA